MKQDRPNWCPHKDCIFLVHSQSMICTGKLQKPELHIDTYNSHRFCLAQDGDKLLLDLQLNWDDAWNIRRILNVIKEWREMP